MMILNVISRKPRNFSIEKNNALRPNKKLLPPQMSSERVPVRYHRPVARSMTRVTQIAIAVTTPRLTRMMTATIHQMTSRIQPPILAQMLMIVLIWLNGALPTKRGTTLPSSREDPPQSLLIWREIQTFLTSTPQAKDAEATWNYSISPLSTRHTRQVLNPPRIWSLSLGLYLQDSTWSRTSSAVQHSARPTGASTCTRAKSTRMGRSITRRFVSKSLRIPKISWTNRWMRSRSWSFSAGLDNASRTASSK